MATRKRREVSPRLRRGNRKRESTPKEGGRHRDLASKHVLVAGVVGSLILAVDIVDVVAIKTA